MIDAEFGVHMLGRVRVEILEVLAEVGQKNQNLQDITLESLIKQSGYYTSKIFEN